MPQTKKDGPIELFVQIVLEIPYLTQDILVMWIAVHRQVSVVLGVLGPPAHPLQKREQGHASMKHLLVVVVQEQKQKQDVPIFVAIGQTPPHVLEDIKARLGLVHQPTVAHIQKQGVRNVPLVVAVAAVPGLLYN